MKRIKNIALIGAGYWGKNHLRNLSQLDVLHSVLETNDEVIAEREKDFPDVDFVKDEKVILQDPAIKAVVIATPAETHGSLVKRFIRAGKDVFVEKPLCLTVEEGEELVALSEKESRILMVGHILQYHSAVQKLKEIIDFGDMGEIRYLYSNRLNLGKLRIEENVLWSFAPHDISVILMLLNGHEPQSVEAFGGSYITEGIYDTTITKMEFSSNIRCHIYVSWLHPFKEQKLIVIGSRKMAVFDDMSSEKLVLFPYKVDIQEGKIPITQKVEYYIVNTEHTEPLKQELLHFIECIEERKTPKTDGREGLRVLRVLERAQKSLKKG
jgi:UDP-2-acetamido-3-amino-2,3-dideoxy-glucuronate N-acetyltransferase